LKDLGELFAPDGHLSVSLTQQSFAETLIESMGFKNLNASSFATPYRSGSPIDSIPTEDLSASQISTRYTMITVSVSSWQFELVSSYYLS
jgi:hypothetical protein